jgi:hypothetical protein
VLDVDGLLTSREQEQLSANQGLRTQD